MTSATSTVGDPAEWASVLTDALVGMATLIIAVAALYVASRAHRTDKDAFLAETRREWEQLGPDWNRVLMFVYGAEHYYHEVPLQERKDHAAVITTFDQARAGAYLSDEWEWTREQKATVRRISHFLAYASDALVTGKWTVREAYSLLGPNIPRHYQFLLWLAHRKPVSEVKRASPGGGAQWSNTIDQLPEFNTFDQQDALVLLAYLIRAEQCRRSDTHSHFVSEFAIEMRGAEGRAVRRALARTARVRGRIFPRLSLLRLLHTAAHPRKRSGFQFEREPLVKGDERFLFRRPFESLKGANRRMGQLRREAEF